VGFEKVKEKGLSPGKKRDIGGGGGGKPNAGYLATQILL